ncbi:lipase esterase [Fusarium circinatum]|uniref:Lipase esterase n=1 Tax=Fusarium circinatum TaxID=48490 RepID=A0A8H5U2Q8_FUSCI|nr:lipase esterase [Fusarium circinatum]
MTGLKYDPEYLKALGPVTKGPKPEPSRSVFEIRKSTEEVIRRVVTNSPYPDGVRETVFKVKSYDGIEIEVTRFASEETLASGKPTSAVMYFHGGGYVSCYVELFAPQIARFANDSKLPYFAVSYRRAPEHPAPAGVEDGYAALQFVSKSAVELNVDPTKIVLHGDSAGGGLAAGLALMARDRHLDPSVAKQLLVYPMLDDRDHVEKDDPILDLMVWKPDGAKLAWDVYASDVREKNDPQGLSYAIPARAPTLRGLPSTYIDVGCLDLFRDENLEFCRQMISIEGTYTVKRIVDHGAFWAHRITASLTITAAEAAKKAIEKVVCACLVVPGFTASTDAIAWNSGTSGCELVNQSRLRRSHMVGKQGVDQQG